ncbi:integrase catalytic domain-containing protein [Trichonephila clavipes]|nr:integrase catalytic domain-containing protein [Trichonephila clavipes]
MNADYCWKGPDWINNDLKELSSAKILTTCTVEADSVLNSTPLVVESNPLETIISKFSNFTRLIRVIALYEDDILRVGGRLTKQPTLSFDQKFPTIIPKHHSITTLMIRQFHLRGFHSGTQMTLSLIRQQYWIPDTRSTVRREIKRCIECCRFNSKRTYPKMGDLPKQRITQTRPFQIVGTDFAEPILTKCQHLRKAS